MRKIAVDLRKCLCCKSCELACAFSHSEHGTLADALGANPIRRIKLRRIGERFAPVTCRHCVEAPCVFACISGARQRTGKGLRVDASRCVACAMCYMVCPTGSIHRDSRTNSFASCDRCGDGEPRCVQACPTGAMRLIDDEAEASFSFHVIDDEGEVNS